MADRTYTCHFLKTKGFCSKAKSRQCPGTHPTLCLSDTDCYNVDTCEFLHSNHKCKNAKGCTDYDCTGRHPKNRKWKCNKGVDCTNRSADHLGSLLHPKPGGGAAASAPLATDSGRAPRPTQPTPPPASRRPPTAHASAPPATITTIWDLFHPDHKARLDALPVAKSLRHFRRALIDFAKPIKLARERVAVGEARLKAATALLEASYRAELAALTAALTEVLDQRSAVEAAVMRELRPLFDAQPEANPTDIRARINREAFRLKNALPALAQRRQIEDAVRTHQFIIIQGHTGSGKSTQLPQYIADIPEFRSKQVICSQPRKLAAISLAERVAFEYAAGYEKLAKVGGAVGCVAAGAHKTTKFTRIIYTTESKLLYQLNVNVGAESKAEKQQRVDKMLLRTAAIIVDEAHERNVSTDILLGILKDTCTRHPHLKVVVTSATLDVALFKKYFGPATPVLEIPGRLFPVEVIYEPVANPEESLMESVVKCALRIAQTTRAEDGDILCFLTGQEEVESAQQSCKTQAEKRKIKGVQTYALYGRQEPEEQQLVFKKLAKGQRKVIFATDVAETSLTIDGVRYVVDSGYTKDTIFDPIKKLTSLQTTPISKSSAIQRKGRAGRTSSGYCYRLYSEAEFNESRQGMVPEILRKPLNLVAAALLSMGIDPMRFNWIEAPAREALTAALADLEILGAVKAGEAGPELTQLGKVVAELEHDPGIVHMLFKACQGGQGEAACTIAGLLSVASNVFWRGGDEEAKSKADAKRRSFDTGKGDVVSLYNAFQAWQQQKQKKCTTFGPMITSDVIEEAIELGDGGSVADLLTSAADDSTDTETDETDSAASNDTDVSDLGDDLAALELDDAVEAKADAAEAAEQKASQTAAKTNNVRVWCVENYINNKSLMMAHSTARDLRRKLESLGVWKLSPTQTAPVSEDQILFLAFNALLLNVATVHKRTQYKPLMSRSVAYLHPSSGLAKRPEPLALVAFNTILETSRVFISIVSPAEWAWLDAHPQLKAAAADLALEAATVSGLPNSTLRLILGKFNSNIPSLEKQLQCQIEADYANGAITGWCKPPLVAGVTAALQQRADAIRRKLQLEVVEELVTGTMRVAWGTGGTVVNFLHPGEFISATLSNFPSTWREADIRKFVQPCGILRDCTLWTSSEGSAKPQAGGLPSPSATLVFETSEHAAQVARRLDGEMVEAKAVSLAAGGIKIASMFRDIKGQLLLSYATAPSICKATITYGTAMDANAVLQARPWPKTFACGHDPTDPKSKNPALPPVSNHRFQLIENAKHTSYGVFIDQLSPDTDEVAILARLKASGLSAPNSVSVKRNQANANTANAGEDLGVLSDLADLQEGIPHEVLARVDSRTEFIDEKRCRGGIAFYFTSIEALEAAAKNSALAQVVAGKRHRFGQPVRLEVQYTLSLAIHEALWKLNVSMVNAIVDGAKRQGFRVATAPPLNDRLFVSFHGSDLTRLRVIRQALSDVFKCSLYRKKGHDKLFSSYGRERLGKLSESSAYLHWDHRSLTIRVYGSDQLRAEGERQLDALVAELSAMKLDESIIIRKQAVAQVKDRLDSLLKDTGVKHVKLLGCRLVASGTEASIEKLRQAVAQAVPKPRAGPASPDDCPICMETYSPSGTVQVILQECGCKLCRVCLADTIHSARQAVPVVCPMFHCKKPLLVRDLVSFGLPEDLNQIKQSGITDFVLKNDKTYFSCPKPGCLQYLRYPNLDVGKEATVGGQVAKCDECNADYCLTCSKANDEPRHAHVGLTCKAAQGIQTGEVTQLMKQAQALLNSECPRCRKAFLDYDGCCAVTCSCGAGFCGLCLIDTNGDAHSHVANECQFKAGGVFFDSGTIQRCQGVIKRRRVIAFLKTLPLDTRLVLGKSLERELTDIGIPPLTAADLQ